VEEITMLNKYDIDYIIQCLQAGQSIPAEYKYSLFPTIQKEYELAYAGKMRKEDILSDTDEISNVPLQIEKTYNGDQHPSVNEDWKNLLIFGDNLQVLKTIYYDKDPIIAKKVKGKIKLVYIDPPFGTGDDYDGNKGQSAYSAKRKGADFVEFLRRRLILLREVMADDAVIFVRLDYHFGHYIKIVMDEVFGKNNFRNEIVINRVKRSLRNLTRFNVSTESIFFYSKSSNFYFNNPEMPRNCNFCGIEKEPIWDDLTSPGLRNPPERVFFGKQYLPRRGRHFTYTQEKIDLFEREGRLRLNPNISYYDLEGKKIEARPEYLQTDRIPIDNNWTDIKGYAFSTTYPTENSEELLKRVIESCTQEGDLVMDCFAGSGTTLAVAEKLNRRWIGCDIGKLAMYTIQKRLLEISKSKDMVNPKKKYKGNTTAFSVVTAGLYDLGKVFSLTEDKYKAFVKKLFDIVDVDKDSIKGVSIDGEKRGYFVKIYPYWDENMRNADVDSDYLHELHSIIGDRIKDRFYIVAPANSVAFVNDYYEIDGIRYYFLKIPYQVIKELHNQNFKKIKQPQSQGQINDLDEAVGFHFIRQPEVETSLTNIDGNFYITLKKFVSDYSVDEAGKEINNFESLSMVLIDSDYDSDFVMKDYFFAKDLISLSKKGSTAHANLSEDVRLELKNANIINIPIKNPGKKISAIYIDIYGNEFKEEFSLEVQ
jgi:adenine-specific DNA-methyltransferase